MTDGELAGVLASLEHYVPVIPDEVVKHCLGAAGMETDDHNV